MSESIALTPLDLQLLKEQIRKEVLESLKNDPTFNQRKVVSSHKIITDIARSSYNKEHHVYEDMYVGGFSLILRNVFNVRRLDTLYGNDLELAIQMTEELVAVIEKYRKGGELTTKR